MPSKWHASGTNTPMKVLGQGLHCASGLTHRRAVEKVPSKSYIPTHCNLVYKDAPSCRNFQTNNYIKQSTLSVLKCFTKFMISIALFRLLSGQQFISIVDVTNVRTYYPKQMNHGWAD